MPEPRADDLVLRLKAEQDRTDALSRVTLQLASAHTEADVVDILRRSARALCHADGVAVILRDGETCRYVAEDAIGPLWPGESFAMDTCMTGWAMLHGKTAVIADISV